METVKLKAGESVEFHLTLQFSFDWEVTDEDMTAIKMFIQRWFKEKKDGLF